MMKKTPDANLANCQNTKIFFLLIWQSSNARMPECQNACCWAGYSTVQDSRRLWPGMRKGL